MSTTIAETPEVRDVLDRAMKLTAAERATIGRLLLDSVVPPPNADASEEALRAELLRRVEAVERGEMKTYSAEEAMTIIREARERGGA